MLLSCHGYLNRLSSCVCFNFRSAYCTKLFHLLLQFYDVVLDNIDQSCIISDSKKCVSRNKVHYFRSNLRLLLRKVDNYLKRNRGRVQIVLILQIEFGLNLHTARYHASQNFEGKGIMSALEKNLWEFIEVIAFDSDYIVFCVSGG